jgi:hypothetical protein
MYDLRRAGHELWPWDESTGFSIWRDNYANPPLATRFLLQMRWPSADQPDQDRDRSSFWTMADGRHVIASHRALRSAGRSAPSRAPR